MCGSPSFGEAECKALERVWRRVVSLLFHRVCVSTEQYIAVRFIVGNLLVGFTGCESFVGKVTCLKVGSFWFISL